MTNFEWEESDEKYEDIRAKEELPLSDVLHGFDCAKCGEEVWNEDFDGDPNDPCWFYACHECEIRYRVYPSTVRAVGVKEE